MNLHTLFPLRYFKRHLRRVVRYNPNKRITMKTCSSCGVEKEATEFYSKGKEKRTNSMCKPCFNSYCIRRWAKRKERVVDQFGNKCHDCGHSYHPNVFDFHHLDTSTKEYDWTKMRLMSETKMQTELSKCIMLCANCHRIRHTVSS